MDENNQFEVWATEVANTIRSKTKKTEPIPATKFSEEIANIPSLSDLEVNDGSNLFNSNARINIVEELLSICKNLVSTYYMFYKADKLDVSIELSHEALDTLTTRSSYSNMFYGANKIPSIKLASNSSIPTSFESMFDGCTSVTDIDIQDLNANSITSLHYMFSGCTHLKAVKLPELNTSKVNNMLYMFKNCESLEEIPNNLKTSNFTNMYNNSACDMFEGCRSLKNIDLSKMGLPNISSLGSIFLNCSSASRIILPNITNKISDISFMLYGCDSLQTFDFTSLKDCKISNLSYLFGSGSTNTNIEGKLNIDLIPLNCYTNVNMSNLCAGNKCLQSIKLPDLSNSKVNTASTFYRMFKDASSLVSIEIRPIKDTTPINTLAEMFSGCIRLKSIKGLENISKGGMTLTTTSNYYQYGLYRMFYNCESLETINLSSINTKNLSNTNAIFEMFRGCKSLKTLNISHFIINSKISNVIDLFNGCQSLVSLSLPDFTPATSITNTSRMFNDCKSLKTITNLDTLPWTKITDYRYMFYNSGLTKITLPVPTTTIVNRGYNATYMFANCKNLVEVDARMFGPNNDTNNSMKYMFANCPKLTTVDLSNFYISSWYYNGLNGLFQNCTSLKNVKFHHVKGEYIGGTNDYMYGIAYMFEGCSSLEVLDLRYLVKDCVQMGYGTRLFAECRKLRKLDLRGGGYGSLGPGSSAWANGVKETFLNCGVDNSKPTIVYVDNIGKQSNIINVAARCGLTWTTDNVIVVDDPETPVDMS